MNDWYDDEEFDGPQGKSKTQVKKEMHALQDLGKELTQLNREQLAQIPLPDDLLLAITQAQSMKKREALRRQLQYIGKLMRSHDTEAIQAAYAGLQDKHNREVRSLHVVEQWRDQLIQGDDTQITQFIDQNPSADRQHLRQLVHTARKEVSQQKPPIQARKLFKFIRDCLEQQSL